MNKECLASLYFDNTRYDKISKEHEGSLEWIWTHEEFQNWSTLDASRLLYIQGKPGSGKSTLTKYFNDNLLEREPRAKSAIVAKFFYSYREGEPQKSHYNMLRSILFDILNQNEAFFYHRFQIEHRRQAILRNRGNGDLIAQHYELLKEVLLSLRDHSPAERLYLIIDAVDESEDDDRRTILNLLFDLCSNTKYCVLKIFVASRPLGLLDSQRSKFHSFIRMQDQTKSDISGFAASFLKRLEFTSFLEQATKYIVEHAQGVFLWVQLVKEELLSLEEEGRAEEDIFEFLKSLPTELEDFYKCMLSKVGRKPADLRDGIKMFQFVLFACRPLTVNELLHTLGIPDNLDREFTLSDESFQKRIPREQRIVHCGGNILEISQHHGTTTSYENSSTFRLTNLQETGVFNLCIKHFASSFFGLMDM
jgi:ankyrin repeat domain-containing protein 50